MSDFVTYRSWMPSPTGNQPPEAFALLTPDDGDYFFGEDVTFTWEAAIDADGDPVDLEFAAASEFDETIYRRIEGIVTTSVTMDSEDLPLGASYWRVVALDDGLGRTVSTPSFRELHVGTPAHTDGHADDASLQFAAAPVWPNPAESVSHLAFALPKASSISVDVIGVDGRAVRTLHRGLMPRGRHTLEWDGRDDRGTAATSGVYFFRLQANTEQLVRRVTLLPR